MLSDTTAGGFLGQLARLLDPFLAINDGLHIIYIYCLFTKNTDFRRVWLIYPTQKKHDQYIIYILATYILSFRIRAALFGAAMRPRHARSFALDQRGLCKGSRHLWHHLAVCIWKYRLNVILHTFLSSWKPILSNLWLDQIPRQWTI